MALQISESDWKLLRRLQPIALERFCQIVLTDVTRLASDSTKSAHARYLEAYTLFQERDEELGAAFNDMILTASSQLPTWAVPTERM